MATNKVIAKTAKWIEKAKLIHGNKYDYSKTIYYGSNKNLIIICPVHGEFLQQSSSHIRGFGCKLCGSALRVMKLDEFIAQANIVHNYKYDYINVLYRVLTDYIEIKCIIHNYIFKQQCISHLYGNEGCKKCHSINVSNRIKKSLKDFINQANELFNNKYNYSLVDYKQSHKKVKIICNKHGEFKQTPANHLLGRGCHSCSVEHRTLTLNEFILRANTFHNFKYDYTKFIYKNSEVKGIIICPKHGDFEQRPGFHLSRGGCPNCGREDYSEARRKTIENFIAEANALHDFKYDYTEFIYGKNNKTKGIIICQKHGKFESTPDDHINSQRGCPKCAPNSYGEKYITDFLVSLNYDFKVEYQVKLEGYKFCKKIDFYIEKLNLFIEYNGRQHYQVVIFNGQTKEDAELSFKEQIIRDELIRNYCKSKNINLLEIDGRNYNKKLKIKNSVEQIISSYIFKLKSKLYFTRNKVD